MPLGGERSRDLEISSGRRDALGFESVQSQVLGSEHNGEICGLVVERVLVLVVDVMIFGDWSEAVSVDCAVEVLNVASPSELDGRAEVDAHRAVFVFGIPTVTSPVVSD